MMRWCSFLAAAVLAATGAGLEVLNQPIPGVPLVGPARTGRIEPARNLEPAVEVLESGPARSRVRAGKAGGTDAWVTIKSENFEGAFPNEWDLYGDPTWDDESYRPHGGSWSGYCVGSSVSPPGPYPADARAWMVYGPFSLGDAIDAKVDFYRWVEVEDGYDYLFWGASVDGSNFYGYRLDTSEPSWQAQNFDLTDVPELGNLCGQTQVWIAFLFDSDYSIGEEGVYLDDIVLQKNTSGGAGPDLTFYQPSGWDFPIVPSNVQGTHNVPGQLNPGTNYIDWAGANQGTGPTSDTFFIYLYLDNVPLAGWYVAPPLEPGYYYAVEDYEMDITSGNHALATFQDATNRIAESNEGNNQYSHSWTWGGGGPATYEHVIITSSSFAANFAALGSFIESHLGMNDTVVTVQAIYASYPGRDNQEKVRNFIKDAYSNWSTTHVLLGGDADVVPCRLAYGRVNQTNYLACDLYYSDLDGTWDGNGNSVFGEAGDNIDMYPDVYVGRATASTAAQADRFVSRFTAYSSDSTATYLRDVLLNGFDLDNQTYGQTTMEFYDANYVPSAMKPCHKVYDSHSGNHKTNTLSYLNGGEHIWVHTDHGDAGGIGVGVTNHGWELTSSDVAGLSNGSKYTILVSVACLVGAFDSSDCVVEHFMDAASGGGVAAMVNSRYGWYYQGENPQRSLSAHLTEWIVYKLFGHSGHASLEDFASAKAQVVPLADTSMVYRWCMYCLNLFGEPGMKVWIPGQTAVNEPGPGSPARGVRLTAASLFAGAAELGFELPASAQVRVLVYDRTGRKVRTVGQGRFQAGRHRLVWDGRKDDGSTAAAGMYYVRLETNQGQAGCKLVKVGEE